MQSLHITCVTTIGGYLKIYGQLSVENIAVIQSNIDCLMRTPMIQSSIPEVDSIQIGNFCLALNENKFVRARVMGKFPSVARVSVHYVDYGYDKVLNITDIRMSKFPKELELMAVQSSPFVVSGLKNIWEQYQIKELSDELLFQNVDFHSVAKIGEDIFIQIVWKNKNLSNYIFENKGFGELVTMEFIKKDYIQDSKLVKGNSSSNYLKDAARNIRSFRTPFNRIGNDTVKPAIADLPSFRSMVQGIHNENYKLPYTGQPLYNNYMKVTSQDQQRGMPIFKISTLMVGSSYEVVISDVQNGPYSFWVQLHSTQHELYTMMADISASSLIKLSENPKVGMACIARCPKGNLQYYRAVIQTIDITSCKVLFVDFGISENISYTELFNIPQAFLDIKCFAFRFALSGYKELEPINDNLKEFFKKTVNKKMLNLKVTPLEGPPLVQYGELHAQQTNILNILKDYKNRKIVYPGPESLQQDEIVHVCYTESPKLFCVQKKKNHEAFEKMMDDLFFYCNKNRCILKKLVKGMPCAAKYENAWYRAEILKVESNDRAFIRHIDYGNARNTNVSALNYIDEKFTTLPPQAIQCCLKGFEDNSTTSISDSVTNQFEMLTEASDGGRRNFKVKLFKVIPTNYYLLNLIDDTLQPELNLMKRLFKLNLPFNKYIGMEKELNANTPTAIVTEMQASKNQSSNGFAQQQSVKSPVSMPQRQSIPVVNINQAAENQSSNWDRASTASNESNRGGNNGFRRGQRKNSPMQRDKRNSSKESNSSSGRSGRGGSAGSRGRNLPPRLQKQYDNDRRYNNNSYDKNQQLSSETSGTYSQSANVSKSSFPKSGNVSTEDWCKRTSTPAPRSTDIEYDNPIEEFLPFNFELKQIDITTPATHEVVICWWISPHQFFTHDNNLTPQFEKMMRKMQSFYKNKSPSDNSVIEVGSTIVARYKQDNVLYRAKVLACNAQLKKYKVEFVDFGNQSIVAESDIWQLEKRFSEMPVMAKLCCFENIVSNFDHKHITDFVAKYFRQGVTLTCSYLKKENNFYFVNIKMKDDSLREILIKDGLISELKQGTKLELLIGQQIKGKVVNYTDLLNFKIAIEGCEINLMCSHHNIKLIKSNPNLSSEFKATYENKYCIFDIINVTGDKILMVEPIIPPISVPLICDYPVVLDMLNVKIPHVSSTNKLYAYPVSIEKELNDLLDDMFEFYDKNGEIIKDIFIGDICAANSSDGNWYRAQIISHNKTKIEGGERNNNDSIEVFYVDYGNTEIIDNITKLKRLEEIFLQSSAFAMEVYLPFKSIKKTNNSSIDEEDLINEIKTLVGNYELELKTFEYYEGSWIVDIMSSGYSLLNVLIEKNLGENKYDFSYTKSLILADINKKSECINISSNEKVNDVAIIETQNVEETITSTQQYDDLNEEIPCEIPMQTSVQSEIPALISAYISHSENPGKFYLQLNSDTEELEKLQDNLRIVADQLPTLKTIAKDETCIARYSVDGVWYRAKVFDNELLAVKFIDYGNIDVVDPTDIKQIVEPFTDIKTFAIPCSLAVIPKNTTDWPDSASKIFHESHEKLVHFSYILKSEKKNFINLYIDGINITEKLCSEDIVKRLEVVKSGENCFISHINSLSEFYIQMETDSDALEVIACYLERFSEFPVIPRNSSSSSNIIGVICAALFPDDNGWYRAKILSETTDGFEVLFVDFGNTTITNEARIISDEIAKVPYLSKKCSLRMSNDILEWSQKAEDKFIELSAGGQTVFVVELKKPGEAAIVDLFSDEVNLLEILQPLCEKNLNDKIKLPAIEMSMSMTMSTLSDGGGLITEPESVVVSHVNSPIDFYVQLNSEIKDLETITDKLMDDYETLLTPEIGEICSALYHEDSNYYRAKILSKESDDYSVLYIDFGNTSITNSFKNLPNNMKNVPPLAKHCSLAGVGFSLSAPNVIEKFNEILAPFFTENIDMTVLDKKTDPWVVRLTLNGEDICKKLKAELGYESLSRSDIYSGTLSTNEKIKNVIISHMVSIQEFYIQFENEANQVENITNQLEKFDELIQVVDLPIINDIYAAIFPEDGCYYRAKVLSVTPNEANVYFIDFGNSSTTTDLRILTEDLKSFKNMANKCSLIIENLNIEPKSLDQMFLKYMDSHFGETFQMEIINPADDTWQVKLLINGVDISQEIERLNSISSNDEISVNTFMKCNISHFTGPNDFYIQIADKINNLDQMTSRLLEAETFSKLESPKVGDICAAKFPDDGAYYRAKVLSIDETENFEVIYIDFGNTAFTDDLRELPEDLKVFEPYAKHCALENLTEINVGSNAEDCFSNIIDEHFNETFQINIIKENTSNNLAEKFSTIDKDVAIVRLYYQDTNIAEKLFTELKNKIEANNNNNSASTNWDTTINTETTTGIVQGIFDEIFDCSIVINEVLNDIFDINNFSVNEIINDIINSCPIDKQSNDIPLVRSVSTSSSEMAASNKIVSNIFDDILDNSMVVTDIIDGIIDSVVIGSEIFNDILNSIN